jgi:5-(carboxyamino)imidazole ribonucleotide synthase
VHNPLKQRIGIIGGGQLGRMMIEETLRLNIVFNTLDAADAPCALLSQTHIIGKLTDGQAIQKLADISDVLTFEIEHIDVQTLLQLEAEGKRIIPSPKILQVIQDKGLQKQFYATHAIPTAPYVLIDNASQWKEAAKQLNTERFAAKTRKDGYDGKGVTLTTKDAILNGFVPFEQPSLLEAFIPCEKEISVMVARHEDGSVMSWPVVEMVFDSQANLVTFLDCPAALSSTLEKEAIAIAQTCIDKLNGVGVFAVEMFVTHDQKILVNEIAPRPHNSGHHTIEACYTSQFEQLVRILAGLPLGSTQLIQPAVMMNLLGAEDFSGSYRLEGLEEAMALPGVYVHLYDKKESKPMRKMGHVTINAPTLTIAKTTAQQVYNLLRFVADK